VFQVTGTVGAMTTDITGVPESTSTLRRGGKAALTDV
jgi:hypothetical protein